jgi:hypothetical protein
VVSPGARADDADRLAARLPGTSTGSTQPSSQAVSVMNFSTDPIVTAPWPENSMTQLPSHSRSCGQMRPQISGMVEVAFELIGFAQPAFGR